MNNVPTRDNAVAFGFASVHAVFVCEKAERAGQVS